MGLCYMAKNQNDLANWGLRKAEQYLESARANLNEDRLYPAAEEIFRATETTFESMLYMQGVKEIRYPGKERPYKGRLALQFLIRDHLLNKKTIDKKLFDKYLEIENELHSAGYMYGKTFETKELESYMDFAEELFFKAQSMHL